jgi:hypothetical protein
MQAFESCSSKQRMWAAVPVTPITTGELPPVQTIVAPASGLIGDSD